MLCVVPWDDERSLSISAALWEGMSGFQSNFSKGEREKRGWRMKTDCGSRLGRGDCKKEGGENGKERANHKVVVYVYDEGDVMCASHCRIYNFLTISSKSLKVGNRGRDLIVMNKFEHVRRCDVTPLNNKRNLVTAQFPGFCRTEKKTQKTA